MKNYKIFFASVTLLILFAFVACSTKATPSKIPVTTSTVNNQFEYTVTPTTTSTTETQQQSLVFVQKPSDDSSTNLEIQTMLQNYADMHQLQLTLSDSLNETLIQTADLIILDQPQQDWIGFANQFPLKQFIVISSKTNDLPENTYQISIPIEDIYFIAGYAAALTSEDWRAAAIVPDDSIDGSSLTQIFTNGTKYLCGLCAPTYAPVVFFPVVAKAPLGADENAVELAYGEIANNRPNVIFIPSQFLTSDLATSLRQNGLVIISDFSNSPLMNDLMDIRINYSVVDSLNQLLSAGLPTENHIIKPELTVETQLSKLSTGKITNLDKVISDLQAGFISPFSVP